MALIDGLLTHSRPTVERYLGLFLWYNDDCDPDYLPAGFEDCVLGDISFPAARVCEIESQALRPYQDGVHGYVPTEDSLLARADSWLYSFQVAATYVSTILDVPEDELLADLLQSDLSYDQVRNPDADIQMLEAPTTSGHGEAKPSTSSQEKRTSSQDKHQFSASSRVVPSTSEEDASLDGHRIAASSSRSGLKENNMITATDSENGQSQLVDAPVAQVRGLSINDGSTLWSQLDQTQGSMQHSQLSVQAWDATETQKLQHMVSPIPDMLDV